MINMEMLIMFMMIKLKDLQSLVIITIIIIFAFLGHTFTILSLYVRNNVMYLSAISGFIYLTTSQILKRATCLYQTSSRHLILDKHTSNTILFKSLILNLKDEG